MRHYKKSERHKKSFITSSTVEKNKQTPLSMKLESLQIFAQINLGPVT